MYTDLGFSLKESFSPFNLSPQVQVNSASRSEIRQLPFNILCFDISMVVYGHNIIQFGALNQVLIRRIINVGYFMDKIVT